MTCLFFSYKQKIKAEERIQSAPVKFAQRAVFNSVRIMGEDHLHHDHDSDFDDDVNIEDHEHGENKKKKVYFNN